MQTGRAYGKLILAGEHAVVYGVPAIAVGIDRGSRAVARPASNVNVLRIAAWSVDVREGGEGDLARAFTALLASARSRSAFSPMQVDASTALPAGGGLGCSAALGVAVARAISPEGSDEDVLADAMAWEKVFHGNPSGVDAAVATRGGAIPFAARESRVSRAARLSSRSDIRETRRARRRWSKGSRAFAKQSRRWSARRSSAFA
jgi:mevalonate kinase